MLWPTLELSPQLSHPFHHNSAIYISTFSILLYAFSSLLIILFFFDLSCRYKNKAISINVQRPTFQQRLMGLGEMENSCMKMKWKIPRKITKYKKYTCRLLSWVSCELWHTNMFTLFRCFFYFCHWKRNEENKKKIIKVVVFISSYQGVGRTLVICVLNMNCDIYSWLNYY